MVIVNGYDDLIAARVHDFISAQHLPWQRRLWNIGTLLALQEVLEASEAHRESHLSEASFRNLRVAVIRELNTDPALGTPEQRALLTTALKTDVRFEGVDYLTISRLLPQVQDTYLKHWCRTLTAPAPRPSIERTARLVASHLLDSGFSPHYLSEWWSRHTRPGAKTRTLADILDDACSLLTSSHEDYEILVAFEKAPRSRNRSLPKEWRQADEVVRWLRHEKHDTSTLRAGGGLLLSIRARDVWSATQKALTSIQGISDRVALGTREPLRVHQRMWVKADSRTFPAVPLRRGVDVKALDREDQLYLVPTRNAVENAIGLIGALNTGSAPAAAAAAWAALESLLVGPGYQSDRHVAANRLADIVACALPRAELTTLAHAHAANASDALAASIRAAANNQERSDLVANAIRKGETIDCRARSHLLGLRRMQTLLRNPREMLSGVREYASYSTQRLYRQRNLVLHWGRVHAVCLDAALRTAAPIVGAGLDRIAHAWFVVGTSPLQLAARARIALAAVSTTGGVSPTSLLD